jgi:hypothetical protein
LDDDPLVFEFLLHRADEYVQFLIHVRPSKIIYNVYLISPELSIRVMSIPANFVLPVPGVFLFDARHEFIFIPCFGLELAATPRSRRKQTRLRFP